ncbi:ribosome maturation factor RimM [Serinibacter salmoneus]|uniref:Ribosome maturation factor RimM n=1 Tax=Serinibacter salmoneus TaxID=556530 RepID=A0A2A9CXZ1_9MICO|nr:ribosome maturation factor RimM [Serinibacter salmoneus]PFG19307.1 16S rRNA processing protein RimM [Serinibacter salmoneus]
MSRQSIPEGQVILARLGAANGLRGEVKLEIRTDTPERLAVGQRVGTDDPALGDLSVSSRRRSGSAELIGFAEVSDRTAAERLRGVHLIGEALAEDDAWYPADLVGLQVRHPSGRVLGEVLGLREMPAHHLLEIREPSGARTSVPFVTAIVPEVRVSEGYLVVDPPGGLLVDEPGEPQ